MSLCGGHIRLHGDVLRLLRRLAEQLGDDLVLGVRRHVRREHRRRRQARAAYRARRRLRVLRHAATTKGPRRSEVNVFLVEGKGLRAVRGGGGHREGEASPLFVARTLSLYRALTKSERRQSAAKQQSARKAVSQFHRHRGRYSQCGIHASLVWRLGPACPSFQPTHKQSDGQGTQPSSSSASSDGFNNTAIKEV